MLAFFIILMALIGFHELGHLLAARSLGVPVKRFSIGFGRRLIGIRLWNIDWCISLLPLGGYVSFGDVDNPQEDAVEAFFGIPPLKRIIIAFAGPAFNLVLPFILYFFVMWVGPAFMQVERGADAPSGAVVRNMPVGWAAHYSWKISTKMYGDVWEALGGMVSKGVSTKDVGGPIMVYKSTEYVLEAGESGEDPFLIFDWIALLSINLGIMNLLPIPVLDGGHILLAKIELLRGKRLSNRALNIFSGIGVVLVLSLVAFCLWADIVRFVL